MAITKTIKSLKAGEILDSRGYPTVEVNLETTDGDVFVASVPAGTSTGKYEAKEIRDGGEKYLGMGVSKAVANINKIIAPKVKGKNPIAQAEIDDLMNALDGTKDKSKLGANAILGVSLAVLKAGAGSQKMPLWKWIAKLAGTTPKLPAPCLLYIEGGLHGRGDLDVQEFMAFVENGSYADQLRIGTEIYHNLREILSKKYGKKAINVGLEGGFTPPIQDTSEALDLILLAARKASRKKTKIMMDIAASTFFKNNRYYLEGEIFSRESLADFYNKLCRKYHVALLEDPFNQDDWPGFQNITKTLGQKTIIAGDDLLVSNISRLKEAQKKQAVNALILKPNQVGTVSETIETAKQALKGGWQVFVKHRSGETCDTFLADLVVGLGTGFLMAGAPNRGERVAKYNRLLRIEEELRE